MESSLHRKGTWESFSNAVRDYIDKGHAEEVCSEDGNTGNVFYLPMHAVIKPSSTTTNIRIVFDGSSKSSSGNSLNDILLPGPNVYPPLADQIIKFRQHLFGLSADISQMFRQIELYQEDRDLHRFVWRESPNQPLKDWRMTRFTFGIASSPFIATEALRQVARDFEDEFLTAAKIVLNDFYVDDLLTGTETLQQAIQLREQLNQFLDRGGFLLRKWRSNSEDLLTSISPDLKETDIVQTLPSPKDCPKTLGIHWDTASDAFYVSTPPLCSTDPLTKRKLTSEIAKVYDILGWYSPAELLVKTLLQQLWENKTDWDDIVSDGIKQVWEQWQTQLPQLTQHPIALCYFHFDKKKLNLQIHGFSDASEKGYAAVVYLRTMYTDLSVSVALVASKTRVAPLKRETIPRLELCGALLLAKLLANVKESLNLSLSQLYAWTDSTIVLDWLDGSPRRLKTFVRNRVAQIMDLLPPTAWRHVPSETNPADCASRGMMPGELVCHGTNFVAGNRQLKELSQFLRQKECKDQIVHFCATQHIEWNFIPEKAPNFSGLWESTVKTVKRHLSVVTKGYILTYEETSTILCQIEAILNSRPLVSIDAPDNSGIQVLTPGHLIIGQPLQAFPDQEVSLECSLLKRWNMCQKITRDF